MADNNPAHYSKSKGWIGQLLFWPMWPLFWLYLYKSNRSRVLVISGGHGLVVKDWMSDGKWIVPGGGIRPAETAEQGAARELKEEVDLDINPSQFKTLGQYKYRINGFNYNCQLFYVELPVMPPIMRLAKELAGYQWLNLNQPLVGCDPLVSLIVERWKQPV